MEEFSKMLYKQEGEIPLVWQARHDSFTAQALWLRSLGMCKGTRAKLASNMLTESSFLVTVWMQWSPDSSAYYYAPVQNNSHRDTNVLPRM